MKKYLASTVRLILLATALSIVSVSSTLFYTPEWMSTTWFPTTPEDKSEVNTRIIYTLQHPTVELNATGNHSATIIFLHNDGDTGDLWSQCIDKERRSNLRVVCPTAEPMSIPLAINGSVTRIVTTWFDKIDNTSIYTNYEDMDEATRETHKMIKAEIAKGIPSERIIIGGYHQGGALALLTALTFPQKLGGVIGFCTELPEEKHLKLYKNVNFNIPILNSEGDGMKANVHNIGMVPVELLIRINRGLRFKLYNGFKKLKHPNTTLTLKEFLQTYAGPL